jgi:predicted MPP superfamily phosphohydrolase
LIYVAIAAALTALIALIIYAHYEATRLDVRRLSLDFPNLPAVFDGYRIVFTSDFHVLRVEPYERRVLESLAGIEGDLLVLGGDFQDCRRRSADGAIEFIDRLGALADRFPDGIIAVRGNHDSRTVREHLKQHDAIRYLSATWHVVEREGARIAIAGAKKWPKKRDRKRMDRAVRTLVDRAPERADLRILVAHWPDYFYAARRARFDLVLSGDTHAGQIRLPLVGPPIRKTKMPGRYAYGLVREDGTTLYTTSGIGTRSVPLRLLCPPEIVVVELRRSS